ncbi:MAG: 16S rRNA methyltransferase [Thermoplasmata archaeon]|nr:16S rRNA methyltransferase [Thermoplasmata archaeon]
MMHLILGDTEVEIVPQSIQGHPAVVKHAKLRKKRPSRILLDASFHHQAIRSKYPEEAERRGRPDIAHMVLMNAQESILNKAGLLRVYVHTRNNDVIHISPETRLPKAYHRFVGLIEHVFQNKYVPNKENPLLFLEKISLQALAKKCGGKLVVLSERGKRVNLGKYDIPEDVTFIIGGFPNGDFLSNIDFADEIISIYPQTLMAWVATYEIITEYERRYLKWNFEGE